MKQLYLIGLLLLGTLVGYSQQTITGKVVENESNEPVVGAIVRVLGTSDAAVTNLDGSFAVNTSASGSQTLRVSSVGFQDFNYPLNMEGDLNLGTITVESSSVGIESVEVVADVAITRKTPVAVSNISGDFIEERTGNQELTEVLAVAPSVFASQETGGYGDSRLTVRGFNDENVVVMVNGVPVNDMENSALYWSNWTGLQDVAGKVQIQRGLGATLLAVPSIGGTVNIISKATDAQKGGWASAKIGNDHFAKYGVSLSTGNMNGWAFTVAGSRTVGDGYVDGNFIDAYSYFGSITKDWNNHSLVLTGFGAPQRHGQGFYRPLNTFVTAPSGTDYEQYIKDQKAGDFNRRATFIDLNAGAGAPDNGGSANSIRYNSGWGYYSGEVNNGFTQSGLFNQYSNFYHKPQVSLSHLWDVSDNFSLTTALYGSWGRGGGASSWGNLRPTARVRNGQITTYGFQDSRGSSIYGGPINWDELLETNISNNPDGIAGESGGNPYYFFRASMNHHNYYGVISKALVDLNDELVLTAGIDGRTYSSDHVRKAIDMFGLEIYQHNNFAYNQPNGGATADQNVFGYDQESLFNRDNTGKVNWIGLFSELEYSNDKITAVLGASGSNKSYKKIQRLAGRDGETDWNGFLGGAVKGGLNYNLNSWLNLYGNAGYLSIQPIFDNVFPGGNNGSVEEDDIFTDAANEKVIAFEAGAGLSFAKFAANLNLYRTNWQDKAVTVRGQDAATMENIYGNALGIDALHQGIELDLLATPANGLRLTGAVSIGDWKWKNNSTYELFDTQGNLANEGALYLENVKVGYSPQSQFNIGADYRAPFGLGLNALYAYNARYYAGFDAEDRDNEDFIGVNPNQLPNYGLTNAGINWMFPFENGTKLRLDFNINNLFDELYVNGASEGFVRGTTDYSPLSELRGNFGFGRTWNGGAKLYFKDGKGKEVVTAPEPVAPTVDLDRDNDGVIDAADDCPDTPGTVNGCPDADGDGVIDAKDDCVNEPGLASNNGCPDETEKEIVEKEVIKEVPVGDKDGDGVVDGSDKCPDTAGPVANEGCPYPAAPVAPSTETVKRMNFLAREVYFDTDSDRLKTESQVKLNEIAALMRQFPSTAFVIEGHTDSVGDAAYNKDLSRRRAASVVRYLVGKGISNSLLSSIGYGEEQPVASNATAEGRAKNRRVVIKLGR